MHLIVNFMYIMLLMPMLGICLSHSILLCLLQLEIMILSLIMILVWRCETSVLMSLLVLTLGACEAGLGLSCLVKIIRIYGMDNIKSSNIIKV